VDRFAFDESSDSFLDAVAHILDHKHLRRSASIHSDEYRECHRPWYLFYGTALHTVSVSVIWVFSVESAHCDSV